jgi:hypothetical protein
MLPESGSIISAQSLRDCYQVRAVGQRPRRRRRLSQEDDPLPQTSLASNVPCLKRLLPQTSLREGRVAQLPLASQCKALASALLRLAALLQLSLLHPLHSLHATKSGACAATCARSQGRKRLRSRFLTKWHCARCTATSAAAPRCTRPQMATAIPSSLDGGAHGVKLQAARCKACSCRCSAAAAAAWGSAGSRCGARRCCWRSTFGVCGTASQPQPCSRWAQAWPCPAFASLHFPAKFLLRTATKLVACVILRAQLPSRFNADRRRRWTLPSQRALAPAAAATVPSCCWTGGSRTPQRS